MSYHGLLTIMFCMHLPFPCTEVHGLRRARLTGCAVDDVDRAEIAQSLYLILYVVIRPSSAAFPDPP